MSMWWTPNHRIQKFTGDGTFLAKWGTLGSGDGEFEEPVRRRRGRQRQCLRDRPLRPHPEVHHRRQLARHLACLHVSLSEAVAADGSGNVYVADTANHRIQKFAPAGALLARWGSYGSGDGQFNRPTGVAVDGGGNVYVADTENHRIQKFTGNGTFLATWGTDGSGDGQFDGPTGVAVDRSGNVYVADTVIDRIQKFTADGTFLTTWGTVRYRRRPVSDSRRRGGGRQRQRLCGRHLQRPYPEVHG